MADKSSTTLQAWHIDSRRKEVTKVDDQTGEKDAYWLSSSPGNTLHAVQKDRQTDVPENEPSKSAIKGLLEDFVDFTTSHGVTHIYKTKGSVKRILWVVLTLVSIGLLITHMAHIFTSYLENLTTTDVVLVTDERTLLFPAVTICNINSIRYSQLPSTVLQYLNEKTQQDEESEDINVAMSNAMTRVKQEVSYLNEKAKLEVGYELADMILYCTFDGDNCDLTTDFTTFHDPNYGNCFTFNSAKMADESLKFSTTAGHLYGLSLVVNVGVDEYLPYLSEEAGVRVVVHNQTDMAFPERQGVSVGIAQSGYLALKKQVIYRPSDTRYGRCVQQTDTSIDNMYAKPYGVAYSFHACLLTCYQQEVVKSCSCFDPRYLYDFSSDIFSDLNNVTQKPCKRENLDEASCLDYIGEKLSDAVLRCDQCQSLCQEARFEISKSSATYPSDVFLSNFKTRMTRKHQHIIDSWTRQNISFEQAVKSNVLKVNVFYESIEYTNYKTQPSYGDYQFISDLGGTFGLWIGWSVLTCFEFIELIISFIIFFCHRFKRANKTSTNSNNLK